MKGQESENGERDGRGNEIVKGNEGRGEKGTGVRGTQKIEGEWGWTECGLTIKILDIGDSFRLAGSYETKLTPEPM